MLILVSELILLNSTCRSDDGGRRPLTRIWTSAALSSDWTRNRRALRLRTIDPRGRANSTQDPDLAHPQLSPSKQSRLLRSNPHPRRPPCRLAPSQPPPSTLSSPNVYLTPLYTEKHGFFPLVPDVLHFTFTMGLGILESRHNPVPGTALVYDDDRKRDLAQSAARSHLKYDKTGKILLVPQPSDDPNDPLVRQPCEEGLSDYNLYANDPRTGRYGNATSSSQSSPSSPSSQQPSPPSSPPTPSPSPSSSSAPSPTWPC
jgi:hypothetical protein